MFLSIFPSVRLISVKNLHYLFLLLTLLASGFLQGVERVFEVEDSMLAVVKVGDGFPSSLIEGVADPFDKVMCLVVDASSLKDLFDFPVALLGFHNWTIEGITMYITQYRLTSY
jgi:hypothetical protein